MTADPPGTSGLYTRTDTCVVPGLLASAEGDRAAALDGDGRRKVADDPLAPPAVLHRLLHDTDWRVRLAAAENPGTPRAGCAVLDGTPAVAAMAAGRPDVLWDDVARLLAVRVPLTLLNTVVEVLSRADRPGGVLDDAARSSSVAVRAAAARVSGDPPLLALLGDDADGRVRFHAARNPATPAFRLVRLAGDTTVDVRTSVAHNPSAPRDTLLELLSERNPVTVNAAASKGVLVWADVAHLLGEGMSTLLASGPLSRPDVPVDVQRQVAAGMHPSRHVVARNRHADPDVLRLLAVDPDPEVRSLVAGNPSAPDDARTVAALNT